MRRMRRTGLRGFKEGAASFYIVAFSTLVLVVIAASFAMTVIAEVARTSNDELSQSAYDSAMAGVEDAKLAYANYQRCLKSGATEATPNKDGNVTCGEIIYWMKHPDCYMVGHILGRISDKYPDDDHKNPEVVVSDTIVTTDGDVTSNTNQAYTCVMINTTLSDYRSTLTSSTQVRVVRGHFENGVQAKNITAVRFSWYSNRVGVPYVYNNIRNVTGEGWRAVFQSTASASASVPPVMELQLVQTADNFTLEQFDKTDSGKTNRATVFLAPTDNTTAATANNDNSVGAWNGTINKISSTSLANTNDRTTKNKPFVIYCPSNSTNEFACSVTMDLPAPVNGTRNNDTFMLVVALPYGQPDTDFAVEYLCADGTVCSTVTSGGSTTSSNLAQVTDAQVSIDSTGRANDLYRRVETRFETMDTSFPFPYYAIQVLGSGTGAILVKNMSVTREYNFYR